MKRVINFSGGRSSALMTILLEPTDNDIVLFTDTMREHPLTYKFIDDFEKFENIRVHKAVYTSPRSPGMQGFDALTNWKTYLPNRTRRICTENLKIITAKRYLKNLGILTFENYIGFRADEQNRILNTKQYFKKVHNRYILAERGITKGMVDQYWLNKPYNLEIPRILGNCDLCFLKGVNSIIKILAVYPELAEKWIKDEDQAAVGKRKADTFIKNITYRQMLEIAQNQKTLFDLNEALPAYSCSCSNF